MKNILYTAVLIAAISGCSRTQIVYNQLDWLLPYYLETYMELSDEQSGHLGKQVGKLLAWHCNTQVSLYAELLRSANTDFQNDSMKITTLEDYSYRIERFWKDILLQASPGIANLLLDADEMQLEELFNGFEKRNQEWLTDFNDMTQEELRKDYTKRMESELDRWFGPLQPTQQQAVLEWSDYFQPLGLEGLQMRKSWQSQLHELTAHRDNKVTFLAGVHKLFSNPETFRSAAYQKRLDYNREKTIKLVYTVGKQLNQEQRHHLGHQVESISRDFEKLSCDDDKPGTSANDIHTYSQYQ